LAKPARLNPFDIGLTGTGKLIGMAISAYPVRADGPIVLALQPGAAYGGGQVVTPDNVQVDSTTYDYLIPAGRYRFTVIADGTPVTATVRLQGLTGSSRLTPTPTSSTTIRDVPLRPTNTSPSNTAAGVVNHTMARAGYAGAFLRAVADDNSVTADSVCPWNGTAPPEAKTQIGCPGSSTKVVPAAAPSGTGVSLMDRYDAGPLAWGGYVVSPERLLSAKEVAFWFEIR